VSGEGDRRHAMSNSDTGRPKSFADLFFSTNGNRSRSDTRGARGNEVPPPELLEKLRLENEMVSNTLLMRGEFFRKLLDPRRSIEDECGFPKIGYIDPEVYVQLFEREAVAARVVEVFPKECFQVMPSVYEDDDEEVVTPWEEAVSNLGMKLRGEQSYYNGREENPLMRYLYLADVEARKGSYGIILLGLKDGNWSQPAPGFDEVNSTGVGDDEPLATEKGIGKLGDPTRNHGIYSFTLNTDKAVEAGQELLYLRVFPEHLAPVTRFEANPTSPRFGAPLQYLITLNDPRNTQWTGIGLSAATLSVHWSRVIHVCDGETFGIPAMRPVLNNLLSLRKLYGGSGEMYWRGAFPGYSFETVPQLGGDVQLDRQGLLDDYENYSNGLQRAMVLMGLQMKSQSPQVVDPTAQINTQIEAICIQLGIPKRVFMGTERGELASSQDDKAWNDRLRQRQATYITPKIIVPFFDRLIALGVLPKPSKEVGFINVEGDVDIGSTARTDSIPPEASKDVNALPMPPQSNPAVGPPAKPSPIGQAGQIGNPSKKAPPFTKGSPSPNGTPAPNKGNSPPITPPGPRAPVSPKSGKTAQSEEEALAAEEDTQTTDISGKADDTEEVPTDGTDYEAQIESMLADDGSDSLDGTGTSGSGNIDPKTGEPIPPKRKLAGGYSVFWPDLTSQSDQEKAQIAATNVQTLVAYIAGGGEAMITPMDLLTKFMGFDQKEAAAMIEDAMQAVADKQAQDQAAQEDAAAAGDIDSEIAAEAGMNDPNAMMGGVGGQGMGGIDPATGLPIDGGEGLPFPPPTPPGAKGAGGFGRANGPPIPGGKNPASFGSKGFQAKGLGGVGGRKNLPKLMPKTGLPPLGKKPRSG
jgi:hypothetical protein